MGIAFFFCLLSDFRIASFRPMMFEQLTAVWSQTLAVHTDGYERSAQKPEGRGRDLLKTCGNVLLLNSSIPSYYVLGTKPIMQKLT
jgi:hypothetical protein